MLVLGQGFDIPQSFFLRAPSFIRIKPDSFIGSDFANGTEVEPIIRAADLQFENGKICGARHFFADDFGPVDPNAEGCNVALFAKPKLEIIVDRNACRFGHAIEQRQVERRLRRVISGSNRIEILHGPRNILERKPRRLNFAQEGFDCVSRFVVAAGWRAFSDSMEALGVQLDEDHWIKVFALSDALLTGDAPGIDEAQVEAPEGEFHIAKPTVSE